MSKFDEAFEAGRKAAENRRTALLLAVTAFMGIDAAIHEGLAHHYGLAVGALVFFLIIMPWFMWNYIKPRL